MIDDSFSLNINCIAYFRLSTHESRKALHYQYDLALHAAPFEQAVSFCRFSQR